MHILLVFIMILHVTCDSTVYMLPAYVLRLRRTETMFRLHQIHSLAKLQACRKDAVLCGKTLLEDPASPREIIQKERSSVQAYRAHRRKWCGDFCCPRFARAGASISWLARGFDGLVIWEFKI